MGFSQPDRGSTKIFGYETFSRYDAVLQRVGYIPGEIALSAGLTAFMSDPEVLILDEPTSGLDPLMRATFLDIIQEEHSRGKTIFMSSHSFDELGKTCDRIALRQPLFSSRAT